MRTMQVLATCELSNISTTISILLHRKSRMAIQTLQTLFWRIRNSIGTILSISCSCA
jgi:hypothetical protein